MPFSFLQRPSVTECARQLKLTSYRPTLALTGLVTGVDNVRHDVHLSPKLTEVTRQHIFRLIAKYGQVEEMVVEEPMSSGPPSRIIPGQQKHKAVDPAEFKRLLTELHVVALNRAKSENNVSIDLLARLAVVKLGKAEMLAQFTQVLERCGAKLKAYEGPRHSTPAKAVEMRERFWRLKVNKKAVLRRVGQDLFITLREIEKETLARMRRSLFGNEQAHAYDLFMNRLLFTEDGRDDYLNAEHYVMLGNYERDPDRFQTLQEIAFGFLKSLELEQSNDDAALDGMLNIPENALELVAGGTPDEASDKGKAQKTILAAWVETLERENVMDHVIASYEVVPLLAQYSPPINAQQLKNALISRTERKRVETLLDEHGKISPDALNSAVKRCESCKGNDRAKLAGRFLSDFTRYHRDMRRLEALTLAMDCVNVITNERLRQLSEINNTLYEFLVSDEQKPIEEKVVHHVILKADIRDSTTLTRTLFERGLNPASYFSLNFYEPVNKLLPKYDASKVFIEGDAVILCVLEREGEPGFGVGRICVLAKEMIEIVRAYNEKSTKSGLPVLELGLGISYQDAPPMYLMDGSSRIMISKALNESDRLSACSKAVRKFMVGREGFFNVYSFQTMEEAAVGEGAEEFLVRYNVGGINLSAEAFAKLAQEISLSTHDLQLGGLWGDEVVRLYSGLVPVGQGLFHKIVIRASHVPYVDNRTFSLKKWTERAYYEVCTNPAVYEYIDRGAVGAAAGD
jgi:hypothetical protein